MLTQPLLGFLRRFVPSFAGLHVAELGDQIMETGEIAKDWFHEQDVASHISIDINGRNRSLPIDLCKPIQRSFHNRFDIVTDFGTTEHVENQQMCSQNIYAIVKPGGLVVHTVPLEGSWPGHCLYWYTPEFFEDLAKAHDYTVLANEVLSCWNPPRPPEDLLVCVALRAPDPKPPWDNVEG